MLPFFDDRGDFPAGVHVGSWLEVDERLGSSTPKRVRLMATLRHLHALAAQTGHLSRFIIFGSFVTNTPEPRDLDLVLVMAEAFRLEDAPRESQTLFSHADADARFVLDSRGHPAHVGGGGVSGVLADAPGRR